MSTVDGMVVDQDVLLNACDKESTEISVNVGDVLAHVSQSCVFIKVQDYFRKVMFEDILYLEASGSYCYIYLKNRRRYTVTHSLAETAVYLAKGPFIRVHRSFMVNVEHVDSYIGNAFYIGEHTVPIGRMYRKTILAGFNILGVRDV